MRLAATRGSPRPGGLAVVSAEVVRALGEIAGPEHVLVGPADLLVYECDGFTIERHLPGAVVLPASAGEVQRVVRVLHKHGVPFLPRGAGTGLSGGTIPFENAVMIPLTRMNHVLAVDYRNRRALVEAGVVNLRLSRAVSGRNYQFAPDPSSQGASTIGGNISENAGGPHTLKYGVTIDHVEALEVVLPDGSMTWTGGTGSPDQPGYDIAGLVCGAEGTLGIVTRACVRLTRNPQAIRTLLAVFETVDDATHCISDIISRGIIPAALEMLDHLILQAVEEAFQVGLPTDAGAVLLIELDGLEAGIDAATSQVEAICQSHRAREVRRAATAQARAELWKARKRGAAAVGRLAPSFVTQDGVVPRTKLPAVLQFIAQVSRTYDIPIANLMHAGDGNLHPILLFDERDEEQVARVLKASEAILSECVRLGGSVTGEHGIGIEKIDFIPRLFSDADIRVMLDLRAVFNPDGRCNPGKIFPTQKTCAHEVTRPRPQAAGL